MLVLLALLALAALQIRRHGLAGVLRRGAMLLCLAADTWETGRAFWRARRADYVREWLRL